MLMLYEMARTYDDSIFTLIEREYIDGKQEGTASKVQG
jgi:hypothetical protein